MKKSVKFIVCILCVALVAALAVTLVACNENNDTAKSLNMVGVELTDEQYAFAFNKNNSELKAQVNSIISSKQADIEAIKLKYLSASADDLNTFGKEYQTEPQNRANELVVATNLDFAPFEYLVGTKIAGIDIEVAEIIAHELNKTLVIKHMDFDAVVSNVANGTCDIGMAALTVNEERLEVVDFSDSYFKTAQVILTRNELTSFDYCSNKEDVEAVLKTLSGNAAKCGGQTGTTGNFYIEGSDDYEGFDNLNFGKYDAPALAVQDMLNGNISFVVVDKAVAVSLLKNFNVK